MKLYVFQHAPTGERALIKLRNYPLPPSLSPLRIYNNLGPVQDQMTRAGNPLSASQHKVSRETESCAHFYNIASLQLLPQPPTPTTTTARLTGHKAAPLRLSHSRSSVCFPRVLWVPQNATDYQPATHQGLVYTRLAQCAQIV